MENGAFPFDLSLAKQPVLEISDSEESRHRGKRRLSWAACSVASNSFFNMIQVEARRKAKISEASEAVHRIEADFMD